MEEESVSEGKKQSRVSLTFSISSNDGDFEIWTGNAIVYKTFLGTSSEKAASKRCTCERIVVAVGGCFWIVTGDEISRDCEASMAIESV